jgi:hypothetical protein
MTTMMLIMMSGYDGDDHGDDDDSDDADHGDGGDDDGIKPANNMKRKIAHRTPSRSGHFLTQP